MGCFNTKYKHQSNAQNRFVVKNVDDEGNELGSGVIEVTDSDIILYLSGKDPVRWPLRCLRRYGFDDELFSFESGRRCPTGPGIYAFKCKYAEELFNLVQEKIHNCHPEDMARVHPTGHANASAAQNSMLRIRKQGAAEPPRHSWQNNQPASTSPHYINGGVGLEPTHPVVHYINVENGSGNISPVGCDEELKNASVRINICHTMNPVDSCQGASGGVPVDDGLTNGSQGYARIDQATTGPRYKSQDDEAKMGRYMNVDTSSSNHLPLTSPTRSITPLSAGPLLMSTGAKNLSPIRPNGPAANYLNLSVEQDLALHVNPSLASPVHLNAGAVPKFTFEGHENNDYANVPKVNYIQLDLDSNSEPGSNPPLSPGTPKTSPLNTDTPTRRPEATQYTTIDFEKTTAAALSMSNNFRCIDDDNSVRKTRHSSTLSSDLS